jgi:hypothetical protein
VTFEISPVFLTAADPGDARDARQARRIAEAPPAGGREDPVIKLGELVMILDLHRQGLSVSAIARQVGVDRLEAMGVVACIASTAGSQSDCRVGGGNRYKYLLRSAGPMRFAF